MTARSIDLVFWAIALNEAPVQGYFGRGIETEEQLDAALSGLREECALLIGAGKKVVLS